jgi:hypothetical protein
MTFRNFCPLLVLFSVISTALGQATTAKPLRPAKVVPAATGTAKPLPVLPPIPRSTATNEVTKPSAPPDPGQDVAKPAETTDLTEKSPHELLHTALKAVKFDRTPNGILDAIDALSQEIKPVDDKTRAAAKRFRLLSNAGRWEELGKHIASLPHEQSPETAYRHLIQAITRPPATRPTSSEPTNVIPPPPGMPVPPRTTTNKPRPMLTQEDVVELLRIAPMKPTDGDLMFLTGLLRSVGKPNLKKLADQLKAGIGRFGGQDKDARKRTVQLLEPLGIGALAQHVLQFVDEDHADWSLMMKAKLLEQVWLSSPSLKNRKAAWEANEKLIAEAEKTETKLEAVKRGFTLAEKLPQASADEWMEKQFSKGGHGLKLIQLVQADVQKFVRGSNFTARTENLKNLKQIVDALLTKAGDKIEPWRIPLTIAGEAWLVEAENTVLYHRARKTSTSNMYGYYDPMLEQQRMLAQQNSTRNRPLAPAVVLENAPDDAWLNVLPESRKTRARAAVAGALLKDKKILPALDEIERLAKLDPAQAETLANTLLSGWSTARNPNGRAKPRMPVGMPVYYPSRPSGTPLTRARQKRNLQELGEILERLAKLPITPPKAESIVAAFEGAHSFAEVYKLDDIHTVLGDLGKLPVESLARLSNSMRQRLASSWRAPQIQQQADTKRKEPQIKAEVIAGYKTQLALLDEGLKAHPDIWQLKLQQAAANFDLAEYQYGNKADLEIYVKHREAAFKAFGEAASLYALQSAVTADKPDALVFQLWFNTNLGASDLSYVTRQQTPEIGNLQQIREAMLVLPDSEGHFKAFGDSVATNSRRLTPELKPRYLKAALVVLEDHPAGESARSLVQHYKDLLDEIELVARIDGDDKVGHTEPFGLFIGLKHTSDIEREAGGFTRYLVGGSKGSPYYYPTYPGQRPAPRDDLEEHLNEKLGENFEVQSITFHDNKSQSRTIGQPGWRETPLAYVLLKAKDASVDRLPELKMDLDFYDSIGPALLPVTTATQVIDARPENAPSRPADELALTQTLDARLTDKKQELKLEIHASTKGLAPSLDKLVDLTIPGFEIEKNEDQGLSIARVESDAERVNAVSERTWLLTLKPKAGTSEPSTFKFPEPTSLVAKSVFKQYSNADLKEVEGEIATAGIVLNPQPVWPWLTGGAIIVALGLAGMRLAKRNTGEAEVTPVYNVPEDCTPFTVIDLLQRIDSAPSKALAEPHRSQLRSTISVLEKIHFAPDAPAANGHGDLQAIARDWVAKVN